MNQDIYLNTLKTHIVASAKKMDIEDDFVFTQNNGSKHTVKKSRFDYLQM